MGFKCDRDVNAALVILQYALSKVSGQELALGVEKVQGVYLVSLLKHETPFIPQAAFSS
ncbi:MAG: transposase [Deltaproteobacteria bacterium]|nr:transposase [Deltaproteobacteria bacterium]